MNKIGRSTLVGLFITLIGLTILLVSFIPVTSSEEAINTSFAVSPGTTYGSPNTGTGYHTRILGKSVLKGEVIIEGDGIFLTVTGYSSKHLENIYVTGRYSFRIDPADDLYTFTFDNTKGITESHVTFTLAEVWTRPRAIGSPPLFITALIGFFLFLTGLITLAITRLKS